MNAMKLEELLSRIDDTMHRAIVASKRDAIGRSRHADLTVAQLAYMEAAHLAGSPTLTALASEMGVTKASASAAVHKLIHRGLMAAEQSEDDARVYFISLTGEGRKVIEAEAAAFRKATDGIRKALSPREVETLERLLGKISEAAGL